MNFFKLFMISFISIGLCEECTIHTLYKNINTKFVVHGALYDYFNKIFDQTVEEASLHVPYLVEPAHYFKNEIRKKFIEEGIDVYTIEDLELVLKSFDYLSIEKFYNIRYPNERKPE